MRHYPFLPEIAEPYKPRNCLAQPWRGLSGLDSPAV